MNIDVYKKGEGYQDKNGCYYEDAESFIATGFFGFCGCGDPESSLKFIRDVLAFIKYKLYDLKEKDYNEITKKESDLFMNEGQKYFTYYILDKYELIEHGSSVPGWLTETGEQILSDLLELYPA